LKKRTKKLCDLNRASPGRPKPIDQKFFASFFPKKKAFLPLALARARYLGSDLFFKKEDLS
jgi:hypothetical protein